MQHWLNHVFESALVAVEFFHYASLGLSLLICRLGFVSCLRPRPGQNVSMDRVKITG